MLILKIENCEIGSQIEQLSTGIDSVIRTVTSQYDDFKIRFMEWRRETDTVSGCYTGLPHVALMDSCSFPYMLLCFD